MSTTQTSSQLQVQKWGKPYTVPQWSGVLTAPFSFEVYKDGVEFESINLTKLNKATMLIGRQPSCDIILENPLLSREHCVIQSRRLTNQIYIYDLGSAYGTIVNKQKIEPMSFHEINIGDIIQFATSTRTYMLIGPDYMDPRIDYSKELRSQGNTIGPQPAPIPTGGLTKQAILDRIRADNLNTQAAEQNLRDYASTRRELRDEGDNMDGSDDPNNGEEKGIVLATTHRLATTAKPSESELFELWLGLPDDPTEDEEPSVRSITVAGLAVTGNDPSASTSSISLDEKVVRTMGKTDRQRKSLIRLYELRTKVESLLRQIERAETEEAFGGSGRRGSRFEGAEAGSRSSADKVASLQTKLGEAERLMSEQRSSLARSFLDKLSEVTGEKREGDGLDGDGRGNDAILFGAFSDKEGGNKRKLYAVEEDDDDGLGSLFDEKEGGGNRGKVTKQASKAFATLFAPKRLKTGNEMKQTGEDISALQGSSAMRKDVSEKSLGLGEHNLTCAYFPLLSKQNLSVAAAAVDRQTALKALRETEAELELEIEKEQNEMEHNLSQRREKDSLDLFLTSLSLTGGGSSTKHSRRMQKLVELERLIAAFETVIAERRKAELIAKYKETRESRFLIEAGKISITPAPTSSLITDLPSALSEPKGITTRAGTEQQREIISTNPAITTPQEAPSIDSNSAKNTNVKPDGDSSKPLSKMEIMRANLRLQAAKNAKLAEERQKLAKEAEEAKALRRARKQELREQQESEAQAHGKVHRE